jgi:hypothetical protein
MPNFQVRFDQLLDTEVIYNVTNWEFPGNTLAMKQQFADVIRNLYAVNLASALTNQWSMQSMTFRQMDGGGAFTEIIDFTSGELVGTSAANMLPTQTALLVSLGYLGPRPNRGRIYFAGLTEDSNNGSGEVLSSTRDTFAGVVEAMADGITLTGGAAFLRIARPDYSTNTWTLNNPVETVIGRTFWATQRRRRKGVGV